MKSFLWQTIPLWPRFEVVRQENKADLTKYCSEKQGYQLFNYKLINPINYNSSLNRFYGVNKNDIIGELDIQDANYFFQGKAIGLSDVIVLDEVVPMNIFEMIQQIISDIFNKNNR